MGKIAGSCLCGSIRYTGSADPVLAGICHCSHCQKQSGSAFSMLVGVPKGSLTFTGEPMAEYRDTGDSGLPVVRRFCPKCGSPILTDAAATPTLDWIKAGTLDDTSWFTPEFHMFCEHMQSWISVDEGLPRIPRNPPLDSPSGTGS
jgi:hypothetical protein